MSEKLLSKFTHKLDDPLTFGSLRSHRISVYSVIQTMSDFILANLVRCQETLTKPRTRIVLDECAHLTHCVGQHVHNLLMWYSHYTLTVDLNDTMVHSDSATFCNSSTEKATNDAILHAESQLILKARSPNKDLDHRGTVYDNQLHSSLTSTRLHIGKEHMWMHAWVRVRGKETSHGIFGRNIKRIEFKI